MNCGSVVWQVLEGLLDDDEDMEQMYLGRKERKKQADLAAAAAEKEAAESEGGDHFSDNDTIPEGDETAENEEETLEPRVAMSLDGSSTLPIDTPFGNDDEQQVGKCLLSMLTRQTASRVS